MMGVAFPFIITLLVAPLLRVAYDFLQVPFKEVYMHGSGFSPLKFSTFLN